MDVRPGRCSLRDMKPLELRLVRPVGMIVLLLLAAIAIDAAPKAKQGFRKVVVHHGGKTSAPGQLLLGIDGEVGQQYERYSVISIDEDDFPAFAQRAALQELEISSAAHYDEIYLPSGVIDARRGTAGSHPGRALRGPYPANRTGLYVVQFAGPILPQWQEAVVRAGAKVIVYVQFNSLVVAANQAAAARIAALPEVQYFDLFHSFAKYAKARKVRGVERDYVVHLADAPGVDGDLRQIGAWSGGPASATRPGIANELRLDVRLKGEILDAVLDLPLVIGVSEPVYAEPSDGRVAASAAGLIEPESGQPRSTPSYPDWLARTCPYCTNLRGEGFFAGIVDTGLNGGSDPHSVHHPELPYARTLWGANYIPGTSGPRLADRNGHGSAVAGVIAGDPASGAAADSGGFPYGTGIAPSAGIFVTAVDLENPVFLVSGQRTVADAASRGVYVQNHSYNRYAPAGTDDCNSFFDGQYESMSQEFDQAVLDTNVTVTVSAGNRGRHPARPANCGSPDDDLLTLPPALAKNVISVGGAENVRPGTGNCHGSASESFNNLMETTRRSSRYTGQASFSAKWYIKPELFAPASNVALHHSTAADGNLNFCEGDGPALPAGYTTGTGTSFAAPAVAGAALLASRRYAETAKVNGVPVPGAARPSLIKAMLVAGARSMYNSPFAPGFDNPIDAPLDPSPNSRGGFGRLALDVVLSAYPARVYINESASIGSTGAVWTQTFRIHDPSLPVKVAIAWSDPAGLPVHDRGTPVINDLDLFVEVGSPCNARYLGNNMEWENEAHGEVSYWTTCSATAIDHANNVELVKFYPAAGQTQFTVKVRGTTGVMTPAHPQRFSAAIYNARELDAPPRRAL